MSENRADSRYPRRHVPPQEPLPVDGDSESRSAAEAEEQGLERKRGEHSRDQKSRWILAVGMWLLMIAIFVIVIGAVCILGWHHLSPERWHWLDEKALRDIKNFVLSGAVVGLGTNYIRRYLETRT